MTLSRSQACSRLSALGWTQKEVHHMIDTVEHWRKSSGDEWTVSRLKAMKQHLINQAAGIQSNPDWISCNPDGSFKGAFKKLSLTGNWKQAVRSLNTIMVYSSLVSTKVTEAQWSKFQSSAETPEPSKFGASDYPSDWILSRLPKCFRTLPNTRPTLDDLSLSGERRAPAWNPKSGRLRTVLETDVDGWLPSSSETPAVRLANSKWPKLFSGMKPDIGNILSSMPSSMRYPVGDPRGQSSWIGKVSFIQEPGFKLRAVANPNRILQLALSPLQKCLFGYLKGITEDHTFDQDSGVSKVEKWLNEGHTVHCVDLSDATNNFPLDIQLSALRAILPDEWTDDIALFEYCATGPWRVQDPILGEERDFRWTKGQPLGLGPSFASFAIGHHLLVRDCMTRAEGDYVMLGDDIALIGDGLLKEYRKALRELGCPVSENKTISSDRVAEFAGKVVLREKGTITPYKWRETSDRNFLQVMKNMGPSALNLLRPRQRKIVSLLAELPEEFGGLGWNPRGLSYEERVSSNLDLIRKLETASTSRYTDANWPILQWRTEKQLKQARWFPFGEPAKAAPGRPDPTKVRQSNPLGRILDTIPPHEVVVSDPFKASLPEGYKESSREGDPRGHSALHIYESKLGLSGSSHDDPDEKDLEP